MRNKNLKNHSIYKIENTKTSQRYIGRTDNLERRKRRHFGDLKNNNHHSTFLQRAFEKYGEEVFEMSVCCSGLTRDEAVELEQLILDECYDDLYNCSRSATTPDTTGYKHTEETKAKISVAMKGVEHPMFGKKGVEHPLSKPFTVIFPDGSVDSWGSTREAAKAYGIGNGSIKRYLDGKSTPNGNKRTAHLKDTIWQYV